MIKLISQFDEPATRPCHATPTCCCCCCSCIVTMISTGVITNRNVRRAVTLNLPPDASLEELSKAKRKKIWLGILAALLVPISLFLTFSSLFLKSSFGYSGIDSIIFYLGTPILVYVGGMMFLQQASGLEFRKSVIITLVTLGAMVAEFFGWLFLLINWSKF